jgi:hypothetical protein
MAEKMTHEEFMQRAYDDTPDPHNATILFSMFHSEGKTPDTLDKGYEGLEEPYAKWLKARGYA